LLLRRNLQGWRALATRACATHHFDDRGLVKVRRRVRERNADGVTAEAVASRAAVAALSARSSVATCCNARFRSAPDTADSSGSTRLTGSP
jgi:hypothetical protein